MIGAAWRTQLFCPCRLRPLLQSRPGRAVAAESCRSARLLHLTLAQPTSAAARLSQIRMPMLPATVRRLIPSRTPRQSRVRPSTGNIYSELDIAAFSPNYSVPYTYNFNLNIQRQLGSHYLAQVGYVGSLSHRLATWYEGDPITPAGHAACLANPACTAASRRTSISCSRSTLPSLRWCLVQPAASHQACPTGYRGTSRSETRTPKDLKLQLAAGQPDQGDGPRSAIQRRLHLFACARRRFGVRKRRSAARQTRATETTAA